jgi:hypothetical protein
MVTSNTLWYKVYFLNIFIITVPTKRTFFQAASRAMLLACLTHSSVLKMGQYIPTIFQWSSNRLYSIISPKIVFIIVTTMRTSNFTKFNKSSYTIMVYLKEEKGTVTHRFRSLQVRMSTKHSASLQCNNSTLKHWGQCMLFKYVNA